MPWSDAAGLRRNNLDLLRLVLAGGVLFAHSFIALGLGHEEPLSRFLGGATHIGRVCVFGFFILSGFLIAASWDRTPSLARFFWHRVLRIYPAFAVMTFLVAFVVAPLGSEPDAPKPDASRLLDVAADSLRLSSRNYEGAFIHNPGPTSNNISVWTVPYELRCYIVVPLIALIPLLPRKATTLLACVLFSAAGINDDSWVPIALAASFSAGMIFYRFREEIPYSPLVAAASLLGLLACACVPALRWPGLAVFGLYPFFFLAFNRRTLCPNLATQFGDISYGTFLYGFPIQQLLVYYLGDALDPYTLFALALPLALTAGLASWHLVEKRFLRLKDWGPFGSPSLRDAAATSSSP